MIDYGKPASNQGQLEGLGERGEKLMNDAREWVKDNPDEWDYYLSFARRESSAYGSVSPNLALQTMRATYRASVQNALAQFFARIAMEQDPRIKFRVAKSMADGYTTAVV